MLILTPILNKLLNCPQYKFSNNSGQFSTSPSTFFIVLLGELNVLMHNKWLREYIDHLMLPEFQVGLLARFDQFIKLINLLQLMIHTSMAKISQ